MDEAEKEIAFLRSELEYLTTALMDLADEMRTRTGVPGWLQEALEERIGIETDSCPRCGRGWYKPERCACSAGRHLRLV